MNLVEATKDCIRSIEEFTEAASAASIELKPRRRRPGKFEQMFSSPQEYDGVIAISAEIDRAVAAKAIEGFYNQQVENNTAVFKADPDMILLERNKALITIDPDMLKIAYVKFCRKFHWEEGEWVNAWWLERDFKSKRGCKRVWVIDAFEVKNAKK